MNLFRLCTILFLLSIGFIQSSAQTDAAKAYVKVDGEVTKKLMLSADDLAKMKQSSLSLKDHDGKEHVYTGVAVQEILETAGVTMGKQLKKEHLSKYLMVKCADGYEVLFSLAELDSSFTDKSAILADMSDGKPLSNEIGPFRFVVSGEKKGARSCYKVTELLIKFAED